MAAKSTALAGLKALYFDIFGTAVDWRSTTTKCLHAQAQHALSSADASTPEEVKTKAAAMSEADWGRFAAEWRSTYYVFVKGIASNSIPYKTIDEHHLDSLRELLASWKLQGLWSDSRVREISLVWHKLDPWADSVQGIKALNKQYATCTLSNGSVELLTDMAEYAGLEWTHVISAEMFGTYKPSPKVYLGGGERLGLKPGECGMVAAHLQDLRAAKNCGLVAIYVARPQEEAWDAEKVAQAREWVDLWVEEDEEGFLTLAKKLGGD